MAELANDTAVKPWRRQRRARGAKRSDLRQPLRGAGVGAGRVGRSPSPWQSKPLSGRGAVVAAIAADTVSSPAVACGSRG